MVNIKKLQIIEAISSNILSKDDASFIMSLTNVTLSLDDSIMSILHLGGMITFDGLMYSDKYSLHEHIVISNEILEKISDIEIPIEKLESLLNE
jgi:hypothetical protein